MILIFDRDPSVILEWLIFFYFFPANLFFSILFGLLCPLFYLDFYIFFLFGLQKHTAACSKVKTRILSELK